MALSHSPAQPDTIQDTSGHSRYYRNYVLFVLTLVYAFNFIDRQIVGILSPFIKADLGLDDAQLGWLKGIYFALLYTLVGIPIAWLADRYSRVNIIAVSLTLWSGFTAASGLASNYMQLAVARIGVGIGEAGAAPRLTVLFLIFFPKKNGPGRWLFIRWGSPLVSCWRSLPRLFFYRAVRRTGAPL